MKILCGSPIRQEPAVLERFLASLDRLTKNSFVFEYIFIDDNTDPASSIMLQQFAATHDLCTVIMSGDYDGSDGYARNDITHQWTDDAIWKVAGFKDRIIALAKTHNVDALFLVDSDIVLHADTIEQLIADKVDIVSNIFWTSWQPGTIPYPNVWMTDAYTLYGKKPGENLSASECDKRTADFLSMLRKPGVYEVGGLGACTLISKRALNAGVSFAEVKNLTVWGEDRHFCIRAVVLGLKLHVDTHYPCYHIYRSSELAGVDDYLASTTSCISSVQTEYKPKLTLSMIVHNEAKRYLEQMLSSAAEYVDNAVIIDDGSTDETVAVCAKVLKNIPYKIVHNTQSTFNHEITLRKQQWNETLNTNPDWILSLDADEIFEKKFALEIRSMLQNQTVNAYWFRLYDMWSETHYRDDQYWLAHNAFRPFLFRFDPSIRYEWNETPQHCGRTPITVNRLANAKSPLRLKHYGWAKEEDRRAKYDRYMRLDPDGKYGWKEQYASILDPSPNLVKWVEDDGTKQSAAITVPYQASTISVIINSAALGKKSRDVLSSSGIPHGQRTTILRDQLLPRLINNIIVNEIIVAGEYEAGEGYEYISSPSVALNATDALQQRADGYSASHSDILIFQHDDHIIDEESLALLKTTYAQDDTWDVLVPLRKAMYRSKYGNTPIQLNNGSNEKYVMGHACVMRRNIAEKVLWSSVNKVFTWDVDHTNKLRAQGARIRFVEDLVAWDLEGRAPDYAW